MVKILNKKEVLSDLDFLAEEIKAGKIFLYPTDTLYGLGGNAESGECVAKINKIKQRSGKALLVIAPSLAWVEENCELTPSVREALTERWPGAYSFILKLKNLGALSAELLNGGDSLGLRRPNHWLLGLFELAGLPFISTSANLSGQMPPARFVDVDNNILEQVDYAINDDEGVSGQPSVLIDARGEAVVIINR